MAMSMMLRSQSRAKVSAALSNICRFSTINRTVLSSNKSSLKLLENKNVTQFLAPKLNLASTIEKQGVRRISLTAPKQSAAGGNHATLWTVERAFSAGLLAILPAALAFPSQPLDTLLAITMVMHAHWGIEAIVIDYVRPVLFGSVIPKVAPLLVIAYSALVLGGLLYFNYTDVGISRAVRNLWAIKGQ